VLQVRELTVEVAARVTLASSSFTIRAGEKVGLVGLNGAGKTSLLRVLAGQSLAAAGLISVQGRLGYVPQNPRPRSAADVRAITHVLSGRDLDGAMAQLALLEQLMTANPTQDNILQYSESEERFRLAGGYSADAEARQLTAGLGLAADRVDLPLGVLSGGERRRIEIARVLFADSDVLMLDEPTNHLDVDAKSWLMGFLRGYRGALLVVSHDLDLLDTAITRVLHLEDARMTEYKGTYSQYRKARAAEEARLAKTAVRQEQEIHRLSTLADIMRRQTAKRAKTAHSLDKRVERLKADRVTAPRREKKMRVSFPAPPPAGRLVLHANGLTKGYGGPPVFRNLSFELERGQRLLVMGLNGAGKTSLLRILAGETQPDQGTWRLGHQVSAGYYAQEHEGIEAGRSVLSHMREMTPSAHESQLRGLLGMLGLSGDIAHQDAGTLSGGEKTKLALAQLVAGAHNLLLLDEPTNNLDPPSRTAMAAALAIWPGSVVLVSHDTEFVEALRPDRILMLPEGNLDYWDDDLLELVSLA
jgi:ATPase subunit of ABC transporter with duplicated ATPase domains